jgi:hypothetical protein
MSEALQSASGLFLWYARSIRPASHCERSNANCVRLGGIRERNKVMSFELIKVGSFSCEVETGVKYSEVDMIDLINESINAVLLQYEDVLNAKLEIDWNPEKAGQFNKMISFAQDKAGYNVIQASDTAEVVKAKKKARSLQFGKVRALFINEGINLGVRRVLDAIGHQFRVKSLNKKGIVTFEALPLSLTTGDKADKVSQLAAGMRETTEKKQLERDNVANLERIAQLEARNRTLEMQIVSQSTESIAKE